MQRLGLFTNETDGQSLLETSGWSASLLGDKEGLLH